MRIFNRSGRRLWPCLVLAWCPILCAEPFLFKDVTSQSRIAFRHNCGLTGKFFIAENVTAGLALFDYNNDGRIDLYFLTGCAAKDAQAKDSPRCRLYRNEGNWAFTDVTEASGLGNAGRHALAVAVADYDNDGWPDVYVTNSGPNVLYHNNRDGAFTDVTQKAGVAGRGFVGAGANFLDADGDGRLDLFVSSYVEVPEANDYSTTRGGFRAYLGPAASIYRKTRNLLYHNNGDGTFTDVSKASGIDGPAGAGMGTICGDVDNDGDTDIIVANDMSANFLFINDGHGHFEERGLLAGMGFNELGEAQGSMGAELGDYDNDGWLDLYVTAYQEQLARLYRNLGGCSFEDVTTQTGASRGTRSCVTWGCGLVDFDNDGHRDLFVACGHLQPNVEAYDRRTTYEQLNRLYRNDGRGHFTDVSAESGDGLLVRRSSRGAAFDDLDNDGDVDIVILNSGAEPTLLRNDTARQGHWLQVRLRGMRSNRDGVGAHVRVTAGDLSLLDEVHSGRGYQSHYGSRLYSGLAGRTTVDRVEITWIGGRTDVHRDVPVDRAVLAVEGQQDLVRCDR